jgi:uncharacterized protein YuzE
VAAEPITNYIITDHAATELKRRELSKEAIDRILKNREQRLEIRSGRVVVQSRIQEFGSEYLVRVFVDIDRSPAEVGTAYRTSKVAKILEGRCMKVRYDSRTDTLSVVLKDNTPVHESDEEKPGVILDYDAQGNLISFEILDASKRVTDTRSVDFQLAE